MQFIQIIPLTEAANDPSLYRLEGVLQSHSENDLEDLWTPVTTEEHGPVVVQGDNFVDKTIQETSEVNMAFWSEEFLSIDESIPVVMIEGSWYALIVENGDYPWL